MTKRYLGRVVVRTSADDFPIRVGEILRVREPVPRYNQAFKEYKIVSGEKQDYRAEVTLCIPTTNKFQVGGPKVNG